jgi:class 3 adenylate cyclase
MWSTERKHESYRAHLNSLSRQRIWPLCAQLRMASPSLVAHNRLVEPPPVRYTTTSDGVSIAWAEVGDGPALLSVPPVPFSHVQEGFAVWGVYFEALTRSFRVVVFDARGTGMSERDVAAVSAETMLLDADAVMRAAGLDRFIVMGGAGDLLSISTCLRLATAVPERVTHVVLDSPYQNIRELADTPFGRTNRALAELDWSVYTQTFFRVLLGWASAEMIDSIVAAVGGWVAPSVGVQYVREWETADMSDLLPQVRQPTLVLRNDPYVVPARLCQRVAAKIPGAQFRQYSDPSYAQAAELIRAFVAESSPPQPAVAPAASPVRTILFTDIESSTALTQRLGDAQAQELLRSHNTIVRDALTACGGTEIKHTGDGIMASFPSASRAIECAVAIQRAVTAKADALLRVRIGLNAGEPVAEECDLFGTAVQLARRICDHADAGAILVSNVVRELAMGKGFLFADTGEIELKGFEDPVRLYEVQWRE